MAKEKPQTPVPTPPTDGSTQPQAWEQLTDSEKIERLGIVVNTLQGQVATLKKALLSHNHADGVVVARLQL
jgi:hypothetical protein